MCKAAAYSKNTYLSGQSRVLAAWCGEKKKYEVLGGNYFDERERQATEKQLVRRLEEPGYQVLVQQPTLAVSIREKRPEAEYPDTIAYRQHLAWIVSKKEGYHPAPPARRASQSSLF